jgi:hypothetical protein
MAPPAVLGVVTHLAVGMGGPVRAGPLVHEPGRTPEGAEDQHTTQPILRGAAQLEGPGAVDMRRPGQMPPEEPAGSTASSSAAGGESSDTPAQEA